MLTNNVLDFLSALAKHNDKDWFQKNKDWYLSVKEEFELFITRVILEVHRIDPGIPVLPAGQYIFRIYRDTRFSHDKTPYKTNLGAFMAPGGKNGCRAGYYLHIEPGACMLAGGIYMPPSAALKAVRNEIFDHLEEFRNILSRPAFRRHFGTISGDKLKKTPQGFPPDHPDGELLKFKSYTLFKEIPDRMVVSEILLREIREVYSAMVPFNRFINRALVSL